MQRVGRFAALAAALWLLLLTRALMRLTRPWRSWRPSDWTPPPTPLSDVTFRSADGVRLRGWIARHDQAPATVICVHGWGSNHTEMAWRAHRLHEAGYAVLLFDFRACGESGGHIATGGVREVHDLEAAIEVAQTHPALHAAPIVLLADSMGATVSLAVAAGNPAVRGVFSDSAFASLEHAATSSFRAWTGLPPALFRPAVEWIVARTIGVSASDLSAVDVIAQIAPRPVVIAHGDSDRLISPADARILCAAAGEPKTLWRVPAAGHVVAQFVPADLYDAQVLELIATAVPAEGDSAAAISAS